MGDYTGFQNEIFEQLRELGQRYTSQVLADFVKEGYMPTLPQTP